MSDEVFPSQKIEKWSKLENETEELLKTALDEMSKLRGTAIKDIRENYANSILDDLYLT